MNAPRPSSDAHSSPTVPEQALRDLMGLLVLPALWAGRDGATILRLMIEAIERIVPLCFTFARARVHADHPVIDMMRVAGRDPTEDEAAAWKALVPGWDMLPIPEGRPSEYATPLGILRVIRLSLGYGANGGKIWFASSAPDFPTFSQLACLRAATTLMTTGLQSARADYEREQASRAKDEFLAMLGHELRNPLAPITTALELIRLHNGDAVPREYQVIERQALHLSRLVDDLLDVTRITRGKIVLRREPIDLNKMVAGAVEDAEPLIDEQRHHLSVDLPQEPARVFGDPMRLAQVFSNLLTNAAKYTDPGGRIQVRLHAAGDQLVVSVQDNGLGISPELLPRLFTIFQQGATTIDRGKGGLGIGLALVKSFVTLHGGTVAAASEGLGKGAVFSVSLPRLPADFLSGEASSATAARAGPPPQQRPLRILLVDDNVDALEGISDYLSGCGHAVRAVTDPVEAIRVASGFQPELAILDLGLPTLDGYALARKLSAQPGNREIRLIALTGYGESKDIEKSKKAGFDLHLTKPVMLRELDAAIARAADLPHSSPPPAPAE